MHQNILNLHVSFFIHYNYKEIKFLLYPPTDISVQNNSFYKVEDSYTKGKYYLENYTMKFVVFP